MPISPSSLLFARQAIQDSLPIQKSSDDDKYMLFKKSLPENLSQTDEKDYDMRYLWEKLGKPNNFYQVQNWDKNKSFEENYKNDIELLKQNKFPYEKRLFALVEDKDDDRISYNYHGNSVEANTLRFLKSKNHPSVKYELDWYNSNQPGAIEFRKKYDLDKSKDFYQYIPKKSVKLKVKKEK